MAWVQYALTIAQPRSERFDAYAEYAWRQNEAALDWPRSTDEPSGSGRPGGRREAAEEAMARHRERREATLRFLQRPRRTIDVAIFHGIAPRTAHSHLKALLEEGAVESSRDPKGSGCAIVWMVSR